MNAIIISKEAYQEVIAKLDTILKKQSEGINTLKETWLSNSEACHILKISSRTLQNYRDKGTLPFSQSQNKIYYKLSDIEAHLNSHYFKREVSNGK